MASIVDSILASFMLCKEPGPAEGAGPPEAEGDPVAPAAPQMAAGNCRRGTEAPSEKYNDRNHTSTKLKTYPLCGKSLVAMYESVM